MTSSDQQLSVTPPSSTYLVGLLALVVLLSVAGASQLSFAKKEYVDGVIQSKGGDLRILAPSGGTVRYNVAVGDEVAEGQTLADLDTDRRLVGGGTLHEAEAQALAGKTNSLLNERTAASASSAARGRALVTQQALSRAAIGQAFAEVASRRQALELEQRRVVRQRLLRTQGFISAPAVEQAESDVLARQAELLAAERAVTQAEQGMAAVQADEAAHIAQSASQSQELEREILSVQQANLQSRHSASVAVVAPRSALVMARATAEGDAAEPGQLLLRLSPAGVPQEAVLLLPATAAGRVAPGQYVALQMSAYPYQTFGLVEAQVTHVDSSTLRSDDAGVLRGSGLPPGQMVVSATARITRVPAGMGKNSLKSGMQFRAAIEIERKSFLAWMTAPLLKNFQ